MKHMFLTMAAPFALVATPADAAVFAFDLTGAYNASFEIDSASLRPPVEFDDDTFLVEDIAGTFDGVAGTAEWIGFATLQFDGGLVIQFGDLSIGFIGPQLFSGTTGAPAFVPGTYSLESVEDLASASLTIRETAGAIPEPATWAMMIAGFGMAGMAMRRRGATTVQTTSA